MRKRSAIFAPSIFALLLAAATYKVFSMPNYSLDSYMYSYLVSGDAPTFKVVPGLPPEYVAMTDEAYRQQAPYYTVKALYVALVGIAAPFVGVLRAPTATSAAAYLLCGWVVWFWLRSLGVKGTWRTITALLIMFSSVVTDTARMGTPDLLCSLLLVTGAWLLTATRQAYLGACSLVLAIYTRTDCLILAGLLLALACWQKTISLRFTAILAVAMLVSYFAVSRLGIHTDNCFLCCLP